MFNENLIFIKKGPTRSLFFALGLLSILRAARKNGVQLSASSGANVTVARSARRGYPIFHLEGRDRGPGQRTKVAGNRPGV